MRAIHPGLVLLTVSAFIKTVVCVFKLQTKPWQELPPTPVLPPNAGRSSVFRTDDATLWWCEFGDKVSNRPPVVLLHGGFGTSDYFGSIIPLITGRKIIVMDVRGHGRSTVDDLKRPLSFELYAADVVALLKELAYPSAAFVGWSMMATATMAAMMNPATSKFVERAFLFGGYHSCANTKPTYTESATYQAFIARAPGEWLKYQPEGDITSFVDTLSTLDRTLPQWTEADLAKITHGARVTVAFGEHEEAITEEEVKLLPTLIKGCNSVTLSGVSHFGMIQKPELLAHAINKFLL